MSCLRLFICLQNVYVLEGIRYFGRQHRESNLPGPVQSSISTMERSKEIIALTSIREYFWQADYYIKWAQTTLRENAERRDGSIIIKLIFHSYYFLWYG